MTLDEFVNYLTKPARKLELSGVSRGDIPADAQSWWDENASALLFILNGVGYCVSEDPSDGYRSMLGDISVIPPALISNTFEPVLVTVQPSPNAGDQVVEFVDATTKEVVMAFGTNNNDDYYPSFVAEWHPEKLALNAAQAQLQEQVAVAAAPAMGTRRALNLSGRGAMAAHTAPIREATGSSPVARSIESYDRFREVLAEYGADPSVVARLWFHRPGDLPLDEGAVREAAAECKRTGQWL